MTYKEAITYMYSQLPMFQRLGKSAYRVDLTNVILLCNALGNPQNNLKCIHIAGTNGKGSVSHLLSAVLQAHGYKTGLYISPHYKDYRERIKVNGDYISKKYVVHFLEKNKSLFENIKPSFFEMTVAMAFCYFKDQKVDFAIIETGLGGRLDATNIISPLLSIITNISFDHADILGDTLDKIAVEKAGIIKAHTPVIIGRRQKETETVFAAKVLLEHAELIYAEDNMVSEFNTNEEGLSKIIFNHEFDFKPDLKGPFQLENYRTVFVTCKTLTEKNLIELTDDKIKIGFQNTVSYSNIMGRWEWKSGNSKILFESAHNQDGIQYLMNWLKKQKYENQHFVIGFVNDKPLHQVLDLFPEDAYYYFVNANLPRALKAKDLKEQAQMFNLRGKPYKSVKNGLLAAKKKAGKNDIIVVTGSIFVVAEVI